MSKKDKVFCFVKWLKLWAKAKLYEQRVQDVTSVYAAGERLFDFSNDSQDVRCHLSSSSEGNKNNCPSSPITARKDKPLNGDRRPHKSNTGNTWRGPSERRKLITSNDGLENFVLFLKRVGETSTPLERGLMYVDTWINQKPTKSIMVDFGATHNFITEAEDKCLNLCWEKDAERMKVMNPVVVKMDDLDVVFGMEFLLEHQSGYYQVRIIEGDEPKTTRVTRYGVFKFLKMSFGLTNAPGTSCTLMNQGFSKRASPQIELLKKDVQWGLDPECQAAFDGLEQVMMEGPVLGIVDVTKPFEVEIDAFDYALRAKAGKTRQFWVEENLLVTKGNRLYVSRVGDLRKKLLHECQETLWAGHPERQRTYALLKKGYFWPNMRDDVMQYTKTCLICQ
ncbi:reverse transcriptase [Cucumis melo var. makuwa]|uniref:Reverse transcriptase n=1 Tax=Cucumis melo var. makuwa TaxID=1194695 RepID=A0A5A7VB53_CUCMM|nr:reverse transcriptase [Cucumis melo var. makuwa]TYK27509.1 reverse transcriptase [Cucumis melo var. makuwa]